MPRVRLIRIVRIEWSANQNNMHIKKAMFSTEDESVFHVKQRKNNVKSKTKTFKLLNEKCQKFSLLTA